MCRTMTARLTLPQRSRMWFMFPPMIRGWCMDIPLHRGRIGWRCRGSGGLDRDFISGLVFRSLPTLDSAGDGMHGAWIGVSTGSSLITRHISHGGRHFSIVEGTTEGGLALRGRGDSKGLWAIGEAIADMRRREGDRE